MRILMTTDTVGGVWTFTQELVAGLLRKDCGVALVSVGHAPTKEQSGWARGMESRWDDFRFYSSPAPLEWMQENQGALTRATSLLVEVAEAFGADVLHSNQFCYGALPLSIPKLVVAHSDVLTWSEACRDEPLEDSPWLRHYRLLVHQGLIGTDAVVAPTRWMLEALGRHFPLPRRRHTISNGRDLHTRRSSGLRALQAVTAGRMWDAGKGLLLLRDVSSPMPLVVAGGMSSEDGDLSCTLDNARLLGPMTQASLLQLFEQSSIYICTSAYEPFGLAPLEAALCGCAVLANDLSSLREVWGEGAIYFNDANSLSALLHTLYEDGEFLKQIQSLSYARAKSFTAGAMASSYLSLYRSLKQGTREFQDVA